MQESLRKPPMNTQSVWVVQCREAVQDLQAAVKQTKMHRASCCQVFAAALAAQVASEIFLLSSILSSSQAQQQQRLCASVTAAIELAQRRIQVNTVHQQCCATCAWSCLACLQSKNVLGTMSCRYKLPSPLNTQPQLAEPRFGSPTLQRGSGAYSVIGQRLPTSSFVALSISKPNSTHHISPVVSH